jgi:fatty-acyl-CoA synthase
MNLSRWLDHHAAWRPGKVALHCEGRDTTYAALSERSARTAGALAAFGVGRGDRVAHLGYNSAELLELLFACSRLGAILVPLNWRLTAGELGTVLESAEPSVLVVESEFDATTNALAGWRRAPLTALASGAPVMGRGALADPVLMVFTSGTTGRPKGAVLTQDALVHNAINAVTLQRLVQDDHALAVLPMFHVGGLNIQTTPALQVGATVTIHRRFDPARTLADIAARRPTLLLAVPAVAQVLFSHPAWPATDLSSVRLAITGSTIVPNAVMQGFHARGIPCGQVYGLTESAPCAIGLGAEEARGHVGSIGKPLLHTAARIVDDVGNDCPPDQPGELLLSGPNLMTGYWRDPAATAAAVVDGWFHTGDIAVCDAVGYWRVIDRKKDVVISGGENVYPAELEAVLAEDARIAEASVIGQADARWGEVPVALVVPKPGVQLDGAAVLALFEGRLARFKHPRAVIFVDALPRNVMGKVQKDALRASLRSR